MNSLTKIGIKHNTDKANYHGFTEFYEDYFRRYQSPGILEVGVLDGSSLRMYDEFFEQKAKILGIDIEDRARIFKNEIGTSDRIKVLHGDILDTLTHDILSLLSPTPGRPGPIFDIIIDDGGHTMEQQQVALLKLWPLLKPGGIFIIEDLHTSLIAHFNPDKTTTTLAIIEALAKEPPEILESRYIRAANLQRISDQTEKVVIYQPHPNPPQGGGDRTWPISITSVIIKKP